MSKPLPDEFTHLQSLADDWALPTFAARYAKRTSVEMTELQQCYDALLPAMPAIMEFLNQYPYDQQRPVPVENLMQLAMSFMDISPAVELFFQPTVPYGKEWKEAQLSIQC